MELSKYRLGELIEQCDERNTKNDYLADDVRGISTEKSFIATKANLNGVSLTSYKVVKHPLSVSARWYLIVLIANPSLTIFYSADF